MIVCHGILVTIVVVLDIGLDIVGGVDVELAIEAVGRWICCKDMGYQWLVRHDDELLFAWRLDDVIGLLKKWFVRETERRDV